MTFFDREKVFIILEIGCNWEGNFNIACEMVERAAAAGVDAVKFQTVIAERIATHWAPKFWDIEGCPGETQFDEFSQTVYLTEAQYLELRRLCHKNGLIFFSTAEDELSAELLEEVNSEIHKISSMNITHFPLIRKLAKTGKPLIISTGASNIQEISDCVSWATEHGASDIALLHCISNYPTLDKNANLNMIKDISSKFSKYIVGYSDHTLPYMGEGIISAAVALGARIIEKHYSFDNTRPGFDHEISVDYKTIERFVTTIRRTEEALGIKDKQPIESELRTRKYGRRSIVAAKDLNAGSIIKPDSIAVKRPGGGMEPREFDTILGLTLKNDKKCDDLINIEDISGLDDEK